MFWLIYAIISCLSFGVQDTLNYHLTTAGDYQFSTAALNTVIHSFIVIVLLIGLLTIYFFKPSKAINVIDSLKILATNPGILIFAILAGTAAMAGNILYFYSQQSAPNINPGVMTAISNGAIILSIVLPFIFYGKKITLKQIIGIIILFFSFIMLGDDKFKGFGKLFSKARKKEHKDRS